MTQIADNSLLPTAYCLLPKLDETAVVAVSGGADSIFLAETLYRNKLRVASCELRDEESKLVTRA